MKDLDVLVARMSALGIRNRILYTGYCDKCRGFFYTYATRMPSLCSKSCRFDNRHLTSDGYYGTYVNGKQVREHRVVAEEMLGRPLRIDEDVHHKDRNKLNNDPSNLQVLSKSEHTKLHAQHNH